MSQSIWFIDSENGDSLDRIAIERSIIMRPFKKEIKYYPASKLYPVHGSGEIYFKEEINNTLNWKKLERPKAVVTMLLSDYCQRDLLLIKQLEGLGIPTYNSADSIALARNKALADQRLDKENLPIANSLIIDQGLDFSFIQETIGLPFITKPVDGMRGDSVILISSKEQYNEWRKTSSLNNQVYLAQKYIESSHGKDLRVLVIGDEALACYQRKAPIGQLTANISKGGQAKAVSLSPEVAKLAIQASNTLGLSFSGVDFLYCPKGNLIICEVNSAPGLQGFMGDIDLDLVGEKIKDLTKASLKRKSAYDTGLPSLSLR